jgi:pectate lyase
VATGRIPINGTAAIQSTIVDAKGDLIAGTGSDAVARLGVGANDTVLTADSSEATGLKWAAAARWKFNFIINNIIFNSNNQHNWYFNRIHRFSLLDKST